MHQIKALREIIFSKTGKFPNSFKSEIIVSLLGYDIEEQKAYGYDKATLEESEEFNRKLSTLLDSIDVQTYLCNLLPMQSYEASNVNVLNAVAIKEVLENGLPIFQFGYLPFAITKNNHGLFLHPSGKVFFGEKHVFFEDSLRDFAWHYYDVNTSSWKEAEFNATSIENTLVTLSTDFETFLFDLLNERLGKSIVELNHKFAT